MQIDLNSVSLGDLEAIYRGSCPSLDREWRKQVDGSAAVIQRAARSSDPVYGVNTGFGKLASVRISTENVAKLQRNLILSHCAGTGDILPDNVVRLAMALKIFSLSRGASGVYR